MSTRTANGRPNGATTRTASQGAPAPAKVEPAPPAKAAPVKRTTKKGA